MATPTAAILDAMIFGLGVQKLTNDMYTSHISLSKFFWLPEPGERNPWPNGFWLGFDFYDDGGGAAIAAYQYGRCPYGFGEPVTTSQKHLTEDEIYIENN